MSEVYVENYEWSLCTGVTARMRPGQVSLICILAASAKDTGPLPRTILLVTTMLNTQTERGFFVTILIAFILALGIVYIVLSVQLQQPSVSGTTLDMSYTSVSGSSPLPEARASYAFADDPRSVFMGTTETLAIVDDAKAAVAKTHAATNWVAELERVTVLSEERTSDSYLRAHAFIGDPTSLTLEGGPLRYQWEGDVPRPQTKRMIEEIMPSFGYFIRVLAAEMDTIRPYHVDDGLAPAVPPTASGPGYPSQPAAEAWLIQKVLEDVGAGDLVGFESALDGAVRDIAASGLNFPASVRASQRAATIFYDAVQDQPGYRTLRESAASEWE